MLETTPYDVESSPPIKLLQLLCQGIHFARECSRKLCMVATSRISLVRSPSSRFLPCEDKSEEGSNLKAYERGYEKLLFIQLVFACQKRRSSDAVPLLVQ